MLLSYRYQLMMESVTHPAIAPRFSLIVPTGDAGKGLGNDRVGYQFNFPTSKIVSDRITLHFNAGTTFFPDVTGHDLVSYNLGASAIYAVTGDFNVMLELVSGWSDGVTRSGGKDNNLSAVISPGFRYAINFKNESQMVLVLATPIGLSNKAPDFGLFFYFSFEHYFRR